MKKIFTKKFIAVLLGVLVAVGASYVNAFTRQSQITTNYPKVINSGTDTQIKGTDSRCLLSGYCNSQISLKSFLVGDYSSGSAVNNVVIDSLGKMAIGIGSTSSTVALDVMGTTGITGTIRSSKLKGTATRTVCANKDGVIILCGNREFNISNSDHKSEFASFMVPDGVSTITVEVYGGGGAGYGTANDSSSDGDSSYFKGSGVNLFAFGGDGAKTPVNGGNGGGSSSVGSGLSIVANISNVTGGNGEDVSPASYTGSQIGNGKSCSGTTYYVIKGGQGGDGGKGGAANNGSRTYGGEGGYPGPTDSSGISGGSSWSFTGNGACNYADYNSDQLVPYEMKNHRPGADGINGIKGQGGSGFGGKGGYSMFTTTSSSCPTDVSADKCFGGNGASGGGGGGYLKADVAVSPGQTFFIKIGGGGVRKDKTLCSSGGIACNESEKRNDQIGGGAISGNGGDGYIKITY